MIGELHCNVVEARDARSFVGFVGELQDVDGVAFGGKPRQQIAQETLAAAGGEDRGIGQDEKSQDIVTHSINACRWPSP